MYTKSFYMCFQCAMLYLHAVSLFFPPFCFVFTGWLHFQTPSFQTPAFSDKVEKNDCIRDMSVRKTVEKNMNSSCSSTDALNLLADLALSNDQVPPQPNPSVEREPERCNVAKSLTSSEQQSVLHALLKNPAVSSEQPLEPSPPAPLMRDNDFVDLVFAEHAYSQPPSSSPLLGLSGTHLGVSTRVLQDQTKHADEDKTLATSAIPEHKPSEYLLTGTQAQRQNFRNSRSVSIKEGSIQVTRQWQEHYDFNLDSKFTSDPKIRVVTRALHGYVLCLTFYYRSRNGNTFFLPCNVCLFLLLLIFVHFIPLTGRGILPFRTIVKKCDLSFICG